MGGRARLVAGEVMTPSFEFAEFPILTTERLRLRELSPGDAESIVALFADPAAMRFLARPPITTPEAALQMINRVTDGFHRQQAIQWAITLLADDATMIGTCGAYAWDRVNRRLDIGYQVRPDCWRRGYATEATQAMVAWLFPNLDLHRIQADCTSGHLASERVLTKCGFTLEGIWRESCWEHGRFVDIKQFGLLRLELPPSPMSPRPAPEPRSNSVELPAT